MTTLRDLLSGGNQLARQRRLIRLPSLGVESALAKAHDVAGPMVNCVRTDRTAKLGVAPEPGTRFAEVYEGPM